MLIEVLMKFTVWPQWVILAAHKHYIVIVITAKDLFHSGNITFSNAISTPNDIMALLYKMNMRKISYVLKRALINIFVNMDIDKTGRCIKTFGQPVNLFRIFIR